MRLLLYNSHESKEIDKMNHETKYLVLLVDNLESVSSEPLGNTEHNTLLVFFLNYLFSSK